MKLCTMRSQPLVNLLTSLYGDAAELHRDLLFAGLAAETTKRLPSPSVSLLAYVEDAVLLLERCGEIKDSFFSVFMSKFPCLQGEIEAVAGRYRTNEPTQGTGRLATVRPVHIDVASAADSPEDLLRLFQKAGALNFGHPGYVERSADNALRIALQSHPLIVVRGEFSIGKSSLLLHAAPYWACEHGAICKLDLMDLRIDDINLFHDEFFAAIGESLNLPATGWREVHDALVHRPLLITLDEFSGLTEDVGGRFIPSLFRLAARSGKQIRIIVATRDPFEDVLHSLKVNAPKFDYSTVTIEQFTEGEMLSLFKRLPARTYEAVVNQLVAVRHLSCLQPKALQCLCFTLTRAYLAGKTDAELRSMVLQKSSYR